MNVFGHYLNKYALYEPFFYNTDINEPYLIIVIPCYNEPELLKSLESIYNCKRPCCNTEVIIVINSSEKESAEVVNQNTKTYNEFTNWKLKHDSKELLFNCININNIKTKDSGVGYARKVGMDEAVRHFDYYCKNGIIIGFDADCTCSENYLVEIEKLFSQNTKANACSVEFEHELEGNNFTHDIYDAIANYELYLRYYINFLKKAQHPFAFQTIGSSFAVKSDVYCKQGGMNKRKAGEDFYFLQKIIPLGNYIELKTTKVYPSPRTSNRVPFGTGAAISKIILSKNGKYYTYCYKAFEDISEMIKNVEILYDGGTNSLEIFYSKMSIPLKKFLTENNFEKNLKQVIENSSNFKNFKIRFFKWFNMFMVLKYMNYSHQEFYKLADITESAAYILNSMNVKTTKQSAKNLCEIFRNNNM